MSTIFILLLFYTKEYKTEKESKKNKTVFSPLFIWQHKQIHTPFFFCSLIMQLRKSCNVENGGKVKMRDSVFPPR